MKTITKPSIQIPHKEQRAQVILSKAKTALINDGFSDKAKEMEVRFMEAVSYWEAKSIIKEYVCIQRI